MQYTAENSQVRGKSCGRSLQIFEKKALTCAWNIGSLYLENFITPE